MKWKFHGSWVQGREKPIYYAYDFHLAWKSRKDQLFTTDGLTKIQGNPNWKPLKLTRHLLPIVLIFNLNKIHPTPAFAYTCQQKLCKPIFEGCKANNFFNVRLRFCSRVWGTTYQKHAEGKCLLLLVFARSIEWLNSIIWINRSFKKHPTGYSKSNNL